MHRLEIRGDNKKTYKIKRILFSYEGLSMSHVCVTWPRDCYLTSQWKMNRARQCGATFTDAPITKDGCAKRPWFTTQNKKEFQTYKQPFIFFSHQFALGTDTSDHYFSRHSKILLSAPDLWKNLCKHLGLFHAVLSTHSADKPFPDRIAEATRPLPEFRPSTARPKTSRERTTGRRWFLRE